MPLSHPNANAANKPADEPQAKTTPDKGKGKGKGKKQPQGPQVPPPPKLAENMGIAPVDYPIKLTKIIVAMSPNILYVDDEVTVAKQVIEIDRIGAIDAPEGY